MAETQPWFLQGLCYTANEFRLEDGSYVCGEGVVDVFGGDLAVTTGGSGLDLFVAAGGAFIANDTFATDGGMYRVFNDAQVTLTATTASGVNPRVDTVIGTVADTEYGGGSDSWTLSVLAGTPNVAAALTDAGIAASAAAVPASSVVLAYVLVPTSFAGPFVNATHILDARNNYLRCSTMPWIELQAGAATSLANNTFTQLALNTLVHADRDSFRVAASGNTIIVQQAGLYDIHAKGAVAGAGGTFRAITVVKNNTNLPNLNPDGLRVAEERVGGAIGYFTVSRLQVQLAAGDSIKVAMAQDTGGAVSTVHSAGSYVSHLVIRRVG